MEQASLFMKAPKFKVGEKVINHSHFGARRNKVLMVKTMLPIEDWFYFLEDGRFWLNEDYLEKDVE